jgi:hypothetical protein
MKKSKIKQLLLAFVITVANISMLNAQTWNFTSGLENWGNWNLANCTISQSNGGMVLTPTSSSLQVTAGITGLNMLATDKNYFSFSLKNETPATYLNIVFWVLMPDGAGGYLAETTKTIANYQVTPNSAEYKQYTINLATAISGYSTTWKINRIRFGTFVSATGGNLSFDYVKLTSGIEIPVTSIDITAPKYNINLDEPLQFSYTYLPANASNTVVNWEIVNGTGTATINESGLVTPQTAGTVTVRATTTDGSVVKSEKLVTISNVTTNVNYIKAWTFDCNSQGWGEYNHTNSFSTLHLLADEFVSSGHLELKHKTGATSSWLFGPTKDTINADKYKYLHFSLSLQNAGNIPESGVGALFVWDVSGNMSVLKSKSFMLKKGQNEYTIDLSTDANWKGNVYINRIHFPQGDQTSLGYTPVTAVYRLDWILLSNKATYTAPIQDTTSACTPTIPILSETIVPVVFGNRVSFKTSFSGSRCDVKLKLWINPGDTIVKTQTLFKEGNIYLNCFDLALNTTYNYCIELKNPAGATKSAIKQITTGAKAVEDMPVNYWMTPSPFILTENAVDHLYDNDNWKEAAEFVQVYKIHGATLRDDPTDNFYSQDFPKLFYMLNKNKMRLALEQVIAGNYSGQDYANMISNYVEIFAKFGGKLEYITVDGMLLRSHVATNPEILAFRTKEEGIEAEAECTRIVQEKYPYLHIIPLFNLPNWDVKDATGKLILHNAGNWTSACNVQSLNDLMDIYFSKLAQKNTQIKYVEIDHPYSYYLTGRANSALRVKAINDYCVAHNVKLIIIVNNTKDDATISFKKGCLDFYDALKQDGNKPEFVDVESWYEFPQYLVPETKENSFTNTLRDLGRKIFLDGDVIVSSQGDVSKITGYGMTLQFLAKWKSSGFLANVDWTIDNSELASIDNNGLLTSKKWGKVIITATSKDGTGRFGTFELTIIDPDQPTVLKIRTKSNLTVIDGIGNTLQLFAEDAITGKTAEVDWSVDNYRAASISVTGLVSAIRTGVINVKAISKQDPLVYTSVQLTIVNNTLVTNTEMIENIRIYPNPVNQYLVVEIPEILIESSICIKDIMGRSVKSNTNLNQSSTRHYVGDLPKGCYFVQVKLNNRSVTKRIIIN